MDPVVLTGQNGPFKYDVYLGFGVCDLLKMLQLQEKLEQHDIVCFPKYNLEHREEPVKSIVKEGIARSRKCLLYVSQSFVSDEHYANEVAEVQIKIRRFSRDMLIVLKDPNLSVVPHELRDFKVFPVDNVAALESREFLHDLVMALKQEPNPVLAVLPRDNIGYGAAYGYYYGYLRLVLPDLQKRLVEETLAGSGELLPRTVRKMLIIMPESCFCPPQFSEDGKIEHTDKFVVRTAHRAGNKYRDYKSSLYKIIDQQLEEEYYFVAELATPLLTMYETYYFGLSGMTRDQLYTERDCFYFTLNAILSHPANRECNGQYKLLYWHNDPAMNGEKPKQFYDFILPEIKEELQHEAVCSGGKGSDRLQSDAAGPGVNSASQPTFVGVHVPGSTPAALYECLNHYKMDSVPRGRCVIINIANFDKAPVPLLPRTGADRDVDMLKQLFEDLKFDVEVHNDLTMETLERLLLTLSGVNHSDYDAFACCFLTHGKLGVLYTSDAKPIRILDIVEYFDDLHCPSLRGKPKMFFIQSCLTGADSDGSSTTHSRSSSPGHMSVQSDEAPRPSNIEPLENHLPQTVDHAVEGVLVNGLAEANETVGTEVEAHTLDWDANVAPTLEPADAGTWSEGRATLVPGRPDFLMSYATLPGATAYRDREIGSLYVSQLATCLRKRVEMDRALRMVSREVAQDLMKRDIEDRQSRFQLPFHLTTGMDKLIVL